MSNYDRIDRVTDRVEDGDADIAELERSISATRATLDRDLSALENKLSPDALIHQAIGYIKTGPNEFLVNLGQTVKRNPVPAALLGLSIGWLMLSGGSRAPGLDEADRVYDDQSWRDPDARYGDGDLYGRTGSYDTSHPRAGAAAQVKDKVRSGAAAIGERASALKQDATGVADRINDKINAARGKMSEANQHAQEVFQRARERVAHARYTLAQQPQRIQAGARDLADHHPFMLGAIAFVAGAVIAASLKRTHIEDEWMGEYRDRALAEAEHLARSELQHGAESAREALDNLSVDKTGDSSVSDNAAGRYGLDDDLSREGQTTRNQPA